MHRATEPRFSWQGLLHYDITHKSSIANIEAACCSEAVAPIYYIMQCFNPDDHSKNTVHMVHSQQFFVN